MECMRIYNAAADAAPDCLFLGGWHLQGVSLGIGYEYRMECPGIDLHCDCRLLSVTQ